MSHFPPPSPQDAAAVPVKSKPTEKECENRKKRNNSVPPHPDPQCDSVAPESSDSCDDNDDDQESIADDLEVGLFFPSVPRNIATAFNKSIQNLHVY